MSEGDWTTWAGDLIVIPLFEPEGGQKDQLSSLPAEALNFDSKVDGALSEIIQNAELKGKPGTSSTSRLSKSAQANMH